MKYSHDLFIYYEINSMSLCYELEVRQEKKKWIKCRGNYGITKLCL